MMRYTTTMLRYDVTLRLSYGTEVWYHMTKAHEQVMTVLYYATTAW